MTVTHGLLVLPLIVNLGAAAIYLWSWRRDRKRYADLVRQRTDLFNCACICLVLEMDGTLDLPSGLREAARAAVPDWFRATTRVTVTTTLPTDANGVPRVH